MLKKRKKEEPARRRRTLEDGAAVSSDRFVKNRTLSGYAAESAAKNKQGTERQRAHRVRARQKQAVVVLGLLIAFVMTLAIMVFNFTTKVNVEAVSDKVDIVNQPASSQYAKDINQYLSQNPSSRFRFSLNLQDLSNFVAHLSPEVKYIKRASFSGLGSSTFDIVLREPVIKWQAGNEIYYVDSEGVSFKNNIFVEPAVELRDSSIAGGVMKDGSIKISKRILEFSGRLVANLQANEFTVEYLSLPEGTTRQVAVHLQGYPTEFIFSIDYPVVIQVDSMIKALEYLKDRGYPERMDLRVPQRVYYK